MKTLYVTLNYFPAQLRGSEWLSYQFARSNKEGKSYVISSNVTSYLGFFLPFVYKSKVKHQVLDGIEITRLPHSWFKYTMGNVIGVLCMIAFKLPLIGKNRFFHTIYSKAVPYAFGVELIGLEEEIRRIKPDVVHLTPLPQIHTIQTLKIIEKINKKKKKKIKIVITPAFHFNSNVFYDTYNKESTKHALNISDKIVCTTMYEKEKMLEHFSVPDEKISVVPIGIPTPIRDDKNVSKYIKQILHWLKAEKKDDKIIVFFLGTRCFNKGLYPLIDAIKKTDRSDIILTVGGQTTLSWKLYMLKSRIFGQNKFIVDLPFLTRAEKEAMYSMCNIFAMPSIVDSFGIVYIEAMSHHKPIIYADEAPQREVVGKAGVAVDILKLRTIVKQLNRLANDSKLRKKIGNIGIERYEKEYTEDIMFNSIQSIYKRLI